MTEDAPVGLVFCSCGLAKHATVTEDGTWVFTCEDCDSGARAL